MVNGHVIFLQNMRHNAFVEQSFWCIAPCTFQCLFISVFFLSQKLRTFSLNLSIFKDFPFDFGVSDRSWFKTL
jgi:hypothetical protein